MDDMLNKEYFNKYVLKNSKILKKIEINVRHLFIS